MEFSPYAMKKNRFLYVLLAVSFLPLELYAYNPSTLFNMNSQIDKAQDKVSQIKETQNINDVLMADIVEPEVAVERVIIKTTKQLTLAQQKDIIGNIGTYNKNLEGIMGFSAYVPIDKISQISKHKLVRSVFVDAKVVALGSSSSTQTSNNYTETISATNISSKIGVSDGVGVAVLDTGVYLHPDISDNVVAFKDFVNNQKNPYDDSGHGTSVAGIIAGSGEKSKGQYVGVAPNVDIVSVKVLDANEEGYVSDVVEAIDWVIENKEAYNIRVINLSLGTDSTTYGSLLDEAAEKAWNNGIVVVASSGNGGPNSAIYSPATSSKVISVGSTTTNYTITPYDDEYSWFSTTPKVVNGTTKPEIYAPGEDIISLAVPNGKRHLSHSSSFVNSWYFKDSGTSFSAPMVSSTAALLISDNDKLSPDEVKSKIVNSSVNVNGIKILNVSKAFGLSTDWTVPSTNTGNNNNVNTVPNTPTDSNKDTNSNTNKPTNTPTTTPSDSNTGSSNTTPDPTPVPTPNTTPSTNTSTSTGNGTNKPNSGSVNDYNGNPNLWPQVKPEPPKVEATLPDKVSEDLTGLEFVKIVYKNKNFIVKLRDPNKYSNIIEIELEYDRLNDVIQLMNTMQHSFTKEDFLFFQYRLKSFKR